MVRKSLAALVAVLTVVAGTVPAASSSGGPTRPVRSCAALVRSYPVPDARTRVESAVVVPAAGRVPEFCDVRGTIEPDVRFQLKLPTRTYRGRYVQYGCGGFCGFLEPAKFPQCGPAFGDAAVATTDAGHRTPPEDPTDTTWARSDQQARDDFFFRAPHVLARVSKVLVRSFYGVAPAKSYFTGCSNGGRQALQLAQRYPHDFDGIVAGAPAGYFGALVGYQAWITRNAIPNDKIDLLHAAVLRACDGLDGLVDGQLDEPRLCRFDPAVLAGQLTDDEIARARRLYAGPSDGGVRLYPGGQSYGSELGWKYWTNPVDGHSISGELADDALKNLVYPIGQPHSSVDSFEFTVRELHRVAREAVKANAMSLDLREFRRAGGKLVVWHGAADPGIPVQGTLDYWQRLTGGRTQDWARLFVVPSLHHCARGDELTDFDPFPALVRWVEGGAAPVKVVAEGRDGSGAVTRTRPVFPYPARAVYDGTGSTDDAANFVPAPGPVLRDRILWAGEGLYRSGPVAP
ncbi:tannase/feruloyl esterase family alpha/beta hydrolase [Lentzea sp. NPDC042327]|uniref:tannase/feruloyl esterase family alpha/beta hydrolase n=1 Tax=Lentzea sp. NPDC042327 TaxID=3154801 RepID=UPI0033E2079F